MNTQRSVTTKWLAALCVCAVALCGCFTKRRPTAHVTSPIQFEHPVFPMAAEGELDPPPAMEFEKVAVPPQLVSSHSAPARPHLAPQPAPERAPVEKGEEPMIAPELTTEESEAAKAEAQRNLDSVEKNLALARKRKLNASQQDLVSKVREFTDGAREALRGSDWERAKILSKKAVVLSEQLAAGL